MTRLFVLLCVVVGIAAAGCSKSKSGPKGPKASLLELNRALQTWVRVKGVCPTDPSELTNFPALHGKSMPAAPPGKKLAINRVARQVVFVDQ